MKNNYEIRGDIAIIFLQKKNSRRIIETQIDAVDLFKVMSIAGTWSASYSRQTKSYYVSAWVRPYKDSVKGATVPLARFLYDEIPDGMVVDHINHDTLDNRRSKNLRIVTVTQNRNNRRPNAPGRKGGNEAFYSERFFKLV